MSILKGRKLKIALIIVLLLSVGISFYSLWNYRGESSSISTSRPQQTFKPGERFAQHGGNHSPGREMSPKHDLTLDAKAGSPWRNNVDNNKGGMHSFGGNRFDRSASSSPYAVPLAVYTVLFFGVSAAAYSMVICKNARIQEKKKSTLIWMLLGAGLFLRIAAAPWIPGHPFDINLFKSWAISAANNLTGFYSISSSDYPPFYIYILYMVGKLASVSTMSHYFTLLIKLPSILADVATAYLLYKVARKYVSFEMSLMIAAFYTFNPAIFINSTFWGQVDSFFTLIVVAAIHLLSQNRMGWSTVLLAAAVLMKPQGIIYLPVLMFELFRVKRLKSWFIVAVSGWVTALLIVAPFSFGQDPMWLFKLYSRTLNEYPYASVNAFNFFSLLGANYKQDTSKLLLFSYHTWGMLFIVIVTLFSWWMYRKGRNGKFASVAALVQIAGVFTFSSSMHERYLFPAAALALLAYTYLQDKRLLWLSAGFSLTIFINTYSIFYNSVNGGAPYNFTLFMTSLLNVLLCVFLAKVVWDHCFLKVRHGGVQDCAVD
ncbi:glycosyltransferase 87 family protein [Collibacillus ludicampi]|uniref:glycosyltransferase 87 family protein n=1 Tax=Collibacillus ludicampi TaxID=2771369 RepID=UPI002495019C|nr:glycosyltransferase 87 family protein [Collibacillus ludicampi]